MASPSPPVPLSSPLVTPRQPPPRITIQDLTPSAPDPIRPRAFIRKKTRNPQHAPGAATGRERDWASPSRPVPLSSPLVAPRH